MCVRVSEKEGGEEREREGGAEIEGGSEGETK